MLAQWLFPRPFCRSDTGVKGGHWARGLLAPNTVQFNWNRFDFMFCLIFTSQKVLVKEKKKKKKKAQTYKRKRREGSERKSQRAQMELQLWGFSCSAQRWSQSQGFCSLPRWPACVRDNGAASAARCGGEAPVRACRHVPSSVPDTQEARVMNSGPGNKASLPGALFTGKHFLNFIIFLT